MKKLFLVPLIVLVACGKAPSTDGYFFGEPQYERNSITVNFIAHSSEKELQNSMKKYGITELESRAAFSVINLEEDTCTIHALDPSYKYEPEFLGHEFAHCFYGQWHSDNNSFK